MRSLSLAPLLLLGLFACNDDPFGPQPGDIEPIKNPTACDIDDQIFELHCFSCHQENGVSPPVMDEEAIRAGVLDYLIVPGNAEESRLYQKATGIGLEENDGIMPPGEGLDELLAETLKLWIDQGATVECSE